MIRAFKNLDTLTSKIPFSLAIVDDKLKRQDNEIPSAGSLLDRSKIVIPGPGGESFLYLLVMFQCTFLSKHWYLLCISMNNKVAVSILSSCLKRGNLTVVM